jgi:spore coat protein CotF
MVVNLWLFLSIGAVLSTILVIAITMIINKRKLKELEVEALKVTNINLKAEVEDAVSRHIKSQKDRIEVLEAIVTDKKYELNENISNLR